MVGPLTVIQRHELCLSVVLMSPICVVQAEKEQQEAEELQKELGLSTEDSLVSMIQQVKYIL